MNGYTTVRNCGLADVEVARVGTMMDWTGLEQTLVIAGGGGVGHASSGIGRN